MTKQFVAEVNGRFGFRFRVFTTGDDRFYLLECVQNPDIRTPVSKSDLQPDVRRNLARGIGHARRIVHTAGQDSDAGAGVDVPTANH